MKVLQIVKTIENIKKNPAKPPRFLSAKVSTFKIVSDKLI